MERFALGDPLRPDCAKDIQQHRKVVVRNLHSGAARLAYVIGVAVEHPGGDPTVRFVELVVVGLQEESRRPLPLCELHPAREFGVVRVPGESPGLGELDIHGQSYAIAGPRQGEPGRTAFHDGAGLRLDRDLLALDGDPQRLGRGVGVSVKVQGGGLRQCHRQLALHSRRHDERVVRVVFIHQVFAEAVADGEVVHGQTGHRFRKADDDDKAVQLHKDAVFSQRHPGHRRDAVHPVAGGVDSIEVQHGVHLTCPDGPAVQRQPVLDHLDAVGVLVVTGNRVAKPEGSHRRFSGGPPVFRAPLLTADVQRQVRRARHGDGPVEVHSD